MDENLVSYYMSRYSGEQIDALLTGLSFEIGGSYTNLNAIKAAFPNGDSHAYQAADTKDIYVWNATAKAWQSVGKLQGPVGDTGPQGPAGAAAGFGSITASVNNSTGVPGVTVTTSGPNTSKNFDFSFQNLKGDRGPQGLQGPKGEKGDIGTPGIYAFSVSTGGDLLLHYPYDPAPDFAIGDDGNLYLNLE